MKNYYTIEMYTNEDVIDEVALADSFTEALVLAFGGCEGNYIESFKTDHLNTVYVVECNGQYKYFNKKN